MPLSPFSVYWKETGARVLSVAVAKALYVFVRPQFEPLSIVSSRPLAVAALTTIVLASTFLLMVNHAYVAEPNATRATRSIAMDDNNILFLDFVIEKSSLKFLSVFRTSLKFFIAAFTRVQHPRMKAKDTVLSAEAGIASALLLGNHIKHHVRLDVSAADGVDTFGVVALDPDDNGVFVCCTRRKRRRLRGIDGIVIDKRRGVLLRLAAVVVARLGEHLIRTVAVYLKTHRLVRRLRRARQPERRVVFQIPVMIAIKMISLLRLLCGTFSLTMRSTAFCISPIVNTPLAIFA